LTASSYALNSGTVSARLGGATADLTKDTGGTVVMSGTNTYGGLTSVAAGTLVVNGTNSGTGAVSIASGATLAGTGTLGGATTVSGIHSVGYTANNGIGTQIFSSSLTYNSGSIFSWQLGSETTTGAGSAFDSVTVGGALSVGGGVFRIVVTGLDLDSSFWASNKTWDVFESDGGTGTFSSFELYDGNGVSQTYGDYGSFSFNSGSGQLAWSAVPEPTNALAGLLIGAGLLRRRRSRIALAN
jgi:autotransporter-associated beta strand protein